ncbi:MAG: hypothetical protein WC992_01620 [Acholeplasmataceae bacterium]|jgi:major membrane immunogen (membrane-anchored lipoprotein)|nr:hypothetical protein [Acholeplasmataceae bacterium]
MKKLIAFFFVALLALSLVACKEKEYATDGVFLGYEVSVSSNAQQVVFVEVTIEKGKVTAFNIDTRQGTRTNAGTTEAPNYTWAWKEKTKKELGNDYGMKDSSEIEKEWFEQAAAIEAYWLENGVQVDGVNTVTVDDTGHIDNVTGASIRDSYSAAAVKALANAKAGKFQAIYCSGTDLYIAELTLTNKGKIDTLVLDTHQTTRDAAAGTIAWNAKTKQELGDDYGMKGANGYVFEDGAWVSSGTTTLEWYEQVALITDYVKANGWSDDLQPVQQRGGSLNGTALLPELAGATIRTGGYFTVLKALFEYAGDAVN